MVKILLFAVLAIYALWRISSFLGKITGMGNRSGNGSGPNGNVRVEKDPTKNKQEFDGGEYVDYEEVK